MPLEGIILNKPYVLLKETSNATGIEPDNAQLMFGLVQDIYQTSDNNYSIEDVVLFNPIDAVLFKYNFIVYYLIDENKILLKAETAAP